MSTSRSRDDEAPTGTGLEEHYTPDEVADRLKLHVSTIFRAMAKPPGTPGHLRSVRPPGMRVRRIPASALAEWLSGDEPGRSVGAPVVALDRRR